MIKQVLLWANLKKWMFLFIDPAISNAPSKHEIRMMGDKPGTAQKQTSEKEIVEI